MQFTSEKATFFQCGFHLYIGDIDDESTIVFKEDYIILGNIKTVKNIFAVGELIVIGNIDCKSIYVSKDFLCLGNIEAELVDVEGKSKVISNEELKNEISKDSIKQIIDGSDSTHLIQGQIIKQDKIEYKKNNHSKNDIENKFNDKYGDKIDIGYKDILSNANKALDNMKNLTNLYEKYINKKGDVVIGKVLRIEENKYIVKLDDIEAKLMKDKYSKFKIGDVVGSYIQTVRYENNNLEVFLAENDRSYITKIIKLEMEKNKYDFNKVFIKEINKESEERYVVYIYSDQHTQETLSIIEYKLKKYLNGREIKLYIYQGKKNISEDIETNKNIDELIENRNVNKYSSINNFYLGDAIYHKKFGKGNIVSIVDKEIAKVEFDGVIKDLNLIYLIKNGLVSNSNIYSQESKIEHKNDKKSNRDISKSKVSILEKYKQKKYTLIEGTVVSTNENYIKFNINNEAVGVLKKENDCAKDKRYNVGDRVICYISSVYIKEDEVEIQIYRNTSNFFKLLYNKYKKELDLKKYNLKLCKFTDKLGVKIVVERKNGFNDDIMLNYVNELVNRDAGDDIVKIIVLEYSPYTFLSKLFNIEQSSIELKNGIYYLNNISKENIDSVNSVIDELHKIISYKVSINI